MHFSNEIDLKKRGGVILSEGYKGRNLAIVVADRIDRNEETLSGV